MPFDLGDAVVLETSVKDAAGSPANAGTATLTITQPDGTTASPGVTAPATVGAYSVTFTPAQAGLHMVRWVFTNPDRAHADVFDVRPTTVRQIMSLADAKAALNKKTNVDDDELRGMIEAATAIVENVIGPVVRRQVVETHHGCGQMGQIALHERQVIDVTSVTYADTGAPAVDVASLRFDGDAGVLRSVNGYLPTAPLKITYTVGRPIVDPAITQAAGIIIDHLWKTQRGHSARPGMLGEQPENPIGVMHGDTAAYFMAGYALPNRAAELLAPFAVVDGFA